MNINEMVSFNEIYARMSFYDSEGVCKICSVETFSQKKKNNNNTKKKKKYGIESCFCLVNEYICNLDR